MSKHFGPESVRVEFITDVLLAICDYRLRLDLTLRELYLQIKAWNDYRVYGLNTESDQVVSKKTEMEMI
jgi:hypothetical protein